MITALLILTNCILLWSILVIEALENETGYTFA